MSKNSLKIIGKHIKTSKKSKSRDFETSAKEGNSAKFIKNERKIVKSRVFVIKKHTKFKNLRCSTEEVDARVSAAEQMLNDKLQKNEFVVTK